MEEKNKKNENLANFFQDALKSHEEEVKDIIEIQKIVQEVIDSEERPQVYQLKVTSNW